MNAKNRTILLVEDEAIIAMGEAQTLRGFGYEVIVAGTGEQAVDIACANNTVSFILMDIDLGRGIDGPHAAQKILEHRHVPIVFLTSHAEREMVDRVRGITRYGYVIKNSGDFVLQSSIEMAYDLFDANEKLLIQHGLNYALNSITDLSQGLNIVMKTVLKLESIDAGGIYLLNQSTGAFDLMAHHGLSPELVSRISHYDKDSRNVGIARSAVPRYGNFEEFNLHDKEYFLGENLRSIAIIPIMARQELIAVLNVGSHTADSIPAGTRIALETIGSGIGSALMRLRTDAALRESELRYRRIAENMSDIVSEVDPDGVIRYLSPSYARIFGEDPESLVGASVLDRVHPDDRDQVVAVYIESVRMKAPRETELRWRHVNGRYIWLRSNGRSFFSESGEALGSIFTSSDITERKRAEDALRVAGAKFRLLFEHSPDGIVIIDPATAKPIEFNETAHRQLGYSRDEFSELSIFDFEVLETPDQTRSRIAHVMRNGREDFETLQRTRQGEIRDIHVTAQYMDIAGRSVYFCIWRDITDRKRAEEAWRESETKYRQLFTHAPTGIYEVDFVKGRFSRVNSLICEYTGYSEQELLTMSPLDILTDDSKLMLVERMKKMAACEPVTTSTEYLIKEKNGNTRWVELNNEFIRHDGRIIGSFVVAHDITERKIADRKIRALLEEKELLLKEVHHRIKNNMATVMGLLSLQAGTMSNPEAITALNEARNRLHSMGILYDKLYRSESHRDMPISYFLPALVDEVISLYPESGTIDVSKNIANFTVSAKLLTPLGIIINEILSNAMKYAFVGRGHGEISVAASARDNRATLVIEDNGNGIPDHVRAGETAGFGLMLVHTLSRQIDGDMKIERDGGTRFTLEFNL